MKSSLLKSKKSTTKTLVLFYTAIVLVCMIVVGFITIRYESILREEHRKLSRYLFASVSQSVDEVLHDFNSLKRQVLNDEEIQSVVDKQTEFRYWASKNMLNSIDNLKMYVEDQKNVDLLFIYLKLSDEVVSSHGILSSDLFYTMYFKNCGISYEDWLLTLRGIEQEQYLNLNFILNKKSAPAVCNMLPLLHNKDAVLVMMTAKDKVLRNLENFELKDKYDVYIYNTYNRLIICEKNTEGEEIPYTVSELENYMNENNDMIFMTSSEDTDWFLATMVPKKIFNLQIVFMRLFVIILSVIGFVLLSFFIRYNIRKNTAYIKRMSTMLKVEDQENEYQGLYHSVEGILDENRMLQREHTKKTEALRRMMLSRMIKGESVSYSDCEKYGVQFPYQYFAVLTFYVEDIEVLFGDATAMPTTEKYDMMQFIIQNVFEEKCTNNIMHSYVTEVDGQMVCLVNIKDDQESSLLQLKSLADEAIIFLKSHFEPDITFALSEIYNDRSGIAEAYVKTLEVLEYKKRLGIQESLLYKDISFDYSDGYLFNLDRENKLISAIRKGDVSQAQEIVNQVFRLLESKNSFSSEYIRYTVHDILSVITKIRIDLPTNTVTIEEELALYQKLQNKPLLEVHTFINQQIAEVCEGVSERVVDKGNKNQKLIQKVIDFVKKNYSESSLNVAAIGEHFDMSPYYVSKLFKEEMGITLIDFLNRYRIQKAKEFMETSNLSAKVIAEKVGFNHVRTFYRLLKKHIEE